MQPTTEPQQQGPREPHGLPPIATRPMRRQGLRPRSSIIVSIVGIGAFTTPAVITSTGLGSIVTLWLVAFGGLLVGLTVGQLLTDTPPAPVLAVRATPTYQADDFFGGPPIPRYGPPQPVPSRLTWDDSAARRTRRHEHDERSVQLGSARPASGTPARPGARQPH